MLDGGWHEEGVGAHCWEWGKKMEKTVGEDSLFGDSSCYTGSLHLPKLQPNRALSAISGMIHIAAELLLL